METVLQVNGVSKYIKKKKIIDNVTFSCVSGEVFGFLGPNGAGKTTLMKMMLGLNRIDKGEIRLNGIDVAQDPERALAHVGGMTKNPTFYPWLTGRQNLMQIARMRGGISEERIDEVLELVGLSAHGKEKVKEYSLEMRQRLGLAQAVLHHPSLLILDEPTNGLDPAGLRDLRDIVKRLAHREGVCVLLSSHLMGEMEMLCDRVAILDRGVLVRVKNLNELTDPVLPGREITFRFVLSPMEKASRIVEEAGLGRVLDRTPDHFDIRMTTDALTELNRRFVQNGVKLQTVAPLDEPHLEDMFLSVTEEGSAGHA